MGMFNDNVSPGRTKWTYTYTGKELLGPATKLHKEFELKETDARNTMAGYMKDMTVSNADPKVDAVKDQIRTFGTLKEQCAVFKHEFNRSPEKEYELGLGDVTFFGLAKD
jgi:hypothetical protein